METCPGPAAAANGYHPEKYFIDRGYRGAKEIPGTKIIIPDNPVNREQLMKSNSYEKDLKEERLLNLKSVI